MVDAPGAAPPGVQWLLGGAPIAGATGRTYTPVGDEEGDQLACTVTAFYPVLDVTVAATSAGVTVLPPAGPTPVREFPSGAATSGIAAGRDGNLWFTEFNGNKIGRINPTAQITELPRSHDRREARRDHGRALTATSGSPSMAATRSGGSPRQTQITEFPVPTAGSDPSGDHGRARRQPLVHRAGRQQDRADHRDRRRSPSSPSPPLAASRTGSRPGPTATSGSPSRAATRSAGSSPSDADHRVPDPHRRQRPRRDHGRARRQPLVHRARRQQDRADQPERRTSPSSRLPTADSQPDWDRGRARTATSGSPSTPPTRSAGSIPPTQITEFAVPTRERRPVRASRRARTATSGSPAEAATSGSSPVPPADQLVAASWGRPSSLAAAGPRLRRKSRDPALVPG